MAQAESYKIPNNGSSNPVVYFAQGNDGGGQNWANLPFGDRTIAYSGCSITSLAMVISYFTNAMVTPTDVRQKIIDVWGNYNHFKASGGQSWEIFNQLPQQFGVNGYNIDSDEVVGAIQDGSPVIQSCKPGKYTKGGHFIVLTGFNSSGALMVNDPSHPAFSYDSDSASYVISNGKGWWKFDSAMGITPSGKYASFSTYDGGALSDYLPQSDLFGKATSALSTLGSNVAAGMATLKDWINQNQVKDYSYTVNYETVSQEITRDVIKTADSNGNGGFTNLLSYPSLVETPFVTLRVGDITFGQYSAEGDTGKSYPNYIDSMSVKKFSGKLNQYTISLVYQVGTNDDPNLLDKVFSSVGYGKVYITYGDYSSPTFVYKEEEAILTKVGTSVNFNANTITYTVECTSSAALLTSGTFDFAARTDKPSTVIRELLNNSTYGLQNVFTGMSNDTQVTKNNLIPTDDQSVEIPAQNGVDPLTYLNYLVTCMSASTNGTDEPLKDSTYHLVICDDNFGDLDLNGCYFKIEKISSSEKSVAMVGAYEVDVGFPSDNQVTSFTVNNDNSWNLLYNYSESITQPQYTYSIDNDGHLVETYSPSIVTSTTQNKMTEAQKTWWTNMTQFPISATIEIKGLVRAAVLMSYIRVNALFFGQKHVTSGLYVITGQVDSISGSGYKTTLSLTRIAGDNDYIQKVKTTVESIIPVGVTATEKPKASESLSAFASMLAGVGSQVVTGVKDFIESAVSGVSSAVGSVYDSITGVSDSGQAIYEAYDDSITGADLYSTGDTAYTIWKLAKNAGCTDAGAAGLLGNIIHEGGLSPTTVEYSFCSELKKNGICSGSYDEIGKQVCQMIDSGKLTLGENGTFYLRKPWGGTYGHTYWGIGFIQWTRPYDRKYGLYQMSKQMGKGIGTYEVQAAYILHELQNGYKHVLKVLQTSNDVTECSNKVFKDYEGPGDGTGPKRAASAQKMYNTYATGMRQGR